MRPTFLIGCGKSKRPGRSPARDLYTGGLFRASLRYAESQPNDGVYVLSAAHGVVALDVELEPYDETLKELNEGALADWGVGVAASLYDLGLVRANARLVVLAGAAYLEGLRLGLRDLCREDPDHAGEGLEEPAIVTPLGRLGIGKRLAWLKRHTPGVGA